jgi:hypothetical protein
MNVQIKLYNKHMKSENIMMIIYINFLNYKSTHEIWNKTLYRTLKLYNQTWNMKIITFKHRT